MKNFKEFISVNENDQVFRRNKLGQSKSGEVTFENGGESITVNFLKDIAPVFEVTWEEVKRVLKQNKFNDDKFGQFIASYEGLDDEDPHWIYVEDTQDDEEYENFDDYDYFYIIPNENRGLTWEVL